MKNDYSMELAEFMKLYLESENWSYSFDEKEGLFRFGEAINGRIDRINYVCGVWPDAYYFYAKFPVAFDYDKSKEMAEYLHRVNNISAYSCFGIDYDYNSVYCSSLLNCNGMKPTYDAIEDCIINIVDKFETYGGGLLDIIVGVGKAKEVFERESEELNKETEI